MSESHDVIQEYLIESHENLDRLDREFVALEKDPQNKELLSSIFRTIHTIKGTCGFLGFSKLEKVAHVGENLLSRMRDGKIRLDADITTALLQTVDAVRSMLSAIETTQSEGDASHLELIERLTRLSAERVVTAEAAAQAPVAEQARPAPPAQAAPPAAPPPPPAPAKPLDPLDALLEEEMKKTNARLRAEIAGQAGIVEPLQATAEKPPAGDSPADTADNRGGAAGSAAESSVRVDVGLLDRLMNLVGELVLSRNQVLMHAGRAHNSDLVSVSQQLNLITSELQEAVIKTRMQPIGNVWNKLPRVVRDVSKVCGKSVRVEMEGQETELDKTVLEAIKDPLTHIVRNSVDHGIEFPQDRTKLGKAEQGCLKLRAFHEGGQVNIEISDDGGGVRLDKVKKKAVEKGLIDAEQAARMNDREAMLLLFKPGFSTADKISNVSGRGVGMDVVKTNIERIGGTVDIQSVPGEGTTIRIRIPLTLAIIPAVIVRAGGERFAIPQVSLLELVRLDASENGGGMESIHGTPVYRLRGNILPLIGLRDHLQMPQYGQATSSSIVVLQAEEHRFGLIVDQIDDSVEIVVKPLGNAFNGMTTYAGATVMGDGRVALILDVASLARQAHLKLENRHLASEAAVTIAQSGGQAMLVFSTNAHPRMALPLSQVSRLEEIPSGTVETSGRQHVVQYRGRIMPLLYLDEQIPGGTRAADTEAVPGDLQVIAHTRGDRIYGLVVREICDIVDATFDLQPVNVRPGVLGSAIIADHVTEILDIDALVNAASTTSRKAEVETAGASHE